LGGNGGVRGAVGEGDETPRKEKHVLSVKQKGKFGNIYIGKKNEKRRELALNPKKDQKTNEREWTRRWARVSPRRLKDYQALSQNSETPLAKD